MILHESAGMLAVVPAIPPAQGGKPARGWPRGGDGFPGLPHSPRTRNLRPDAGRAGAGGLRGAAAQAGLIASLAGTKKAACAAFFHCNPATRQMSFAQPCIARPRRMKPENG